MNILIVGLGSIAKKHIEALKKLKVQCSLYALRSSAIVTLEPDVINIYSLSEAKELDISFAIISNPTSEHKNTILDLLELSCPLFIEKPLYHNLELEEVLHKVKDQNILTYVACNLRFLESLVFMKNKIQERSERLNEVNVYCGSYLPAWRTSDYRQSYSAIPELGGGVHIDLIHELDYLYWIFGAPEKVHSVFRNVSSLEILSFDYANYNLLYDNFCANVVLNYYRRDYKRTFELVFENETWFVDIANNSVWKADQEVFSSTQKIVDTYVSQMKYFLDIVKNNKVSMNSVSDAYNVLKICL